MVNESIKRYSIYLINLNPTIGSEIKKTRPCLILSPDEMNENIDTVIIAPMTTKPHKYPTRIPITLNGKHGWVILDQIRALDKRRIIKKVGQASASTVKQIQTVLNNMLCE